MRRSKDEQWLVGASCASAESADPGEQLRHGERFCEVVVGTGIQACDPITHLAESGQEQDRDSVAARPQGPDQLDRVAVRDPPIEDRGVIVVDEGQLVGRGEGAGLVHGIRLGAQRARRLGAQLAVVLEKKKAHRTIVTEGCAT